MGRTSFPDSNQAAAFLQRVETPDFPISGPSGGSGSGSGSSSKSGFSHATAFRNRTPIYAIPVLPPVRPLQLAKSSDPTGTTLPSYSIATIDRSANAHLVDVKDKIEDLLIDR